jgi:WD repeat-containing protein 45
MSSMASSSSSSAAAVVHVAFNSRATHFVAATATGIRVFASSPLKHVFSKSGFAGEVVSADVTLGSLVAVVLRDTAGDDPSDDDRIRYWSEIQGELMGRDMDPTCRGRVRAVRHAGNHVLVACDGRATLHETSRRRTRRACELDTGPNPAGACALAHGGHQASFVLACPLPGRGLVQVRRTWGWRVDVHAHSSSVACVALSRDGRLLATAGSRGTLLRVFSTTDGKKLQEVLYVLLL